MKTTEWGVRYRQAMKNGEIVTKEKIVKSEEALNKFVDSLDNVDGFIEIVSWLLPTQNTEIK